jgi:ribosomal protein L7Ae-like RNA K-turn-binding protein
LPLLLKYVLAFVVKSQIPRENMENLLKNYVVGLKQVTREANKHNVSQIFLASDADEPYQHSVLALVNTHNIPLTYVPSRIQLAAAYNIEVPSAVVGLLVEANSK